MSMKLNLKKAKASFSGVPYTFEGVLFYFFDQLQEDIP